MVCYRLLPLGAATPVPSVVPEKVASAQPSAMDMLARNRAIEMLKEAGYKMDDGPTEEQKLAAAIDQRALEMLKADGYAVE